MALTIGLLRRSYACSMNRQIAQLVNRGTPIPFLGPRLVQQTTSSRCMCNVQADKWTHAQALSKQNYISRQNSSRLYATSPLSSTEPGTSSGQQLVLDPALDAPPQRFQRLKSHFCRMCGSPMETRKPEGEKEWRHVCSNPACGYIDYFNPRMVVGCIVEHEGRILLARRAIEPCRGKWTVPAGYMELHESTAEGAARETREEVNAEVNILAPYCHWDIPVIGQAYILFRAQLAAPFTFSPGPESLETALFDPKDIPYDSIAFSSVALSLRYYLEDRASGQWRMHHGVIDKAPTAGPNDPGTYFVRDHMAVVTSPHPSQ